MKLFTLEKRFNPKTGKETYPERAESSNLICDFTGELIDLKDYEEKPMYSISMKYCHDSEEIYYYDAEKNWFEKQNIDYASIFESRFNFKVKPHGQGDASFDLVSLWIHNMGNGKHWLSGCSTIEEAMRRSRVRLVKDLLINKKYTPDELGLDGDF